MDPTTLNTVTKGLESSIAATGQLLAKLASRPSPDEAIQLTATVVSVILPGQQGALNTLLNFNQCGAGGGYSHDHGGFSHPQRHHQLTAERDNAVAQADALQRELAKTRAERNDLVSQLHQMERELELAHRDRMQQQQQQHPHHPQYRVSSASSVGSPPTLPAAGPASAHGPARGQHQQHHHGTDPYAMRPSGYPTIVPPRPPPPPPALSAESSSAAVVPPPPRRILQPSRPYTSTPQPQLPQPQSQPAPVSASTNPSSLGSRTASAPGSPPQLFQDLHLPPPPPPPPGSVTDPALRSLTPTSATHGNISSMSAPSSATAVKVELAHAPKRPLEPLGPMDRALAESVNGAADGEQQDVGNHKRARVEVSTTGSPELVTMVSPLTQPVPHSHGRSTLKLPPLPHQPNATSAYAPVASAPTSYALAAEYQQLQRASGLPTSPHSVPHSPAFAATLSQQPLANCDAGGPTSPESLPKIRLHFKNNSTAPSSPPSPSVTMGDSSFYSNSGDPDASFASLTSPPEHISNSPTAHDPPADPNQLALPTRALSNTILSSMKHFPMRYINGILQLTDPSTRVLAHDLIPVPTSPSTDPEADAAKIRKYLAVTNQTLANTSLCLMQVMLARGLGVPIPHAWLLEAIMRTSGSKRSAAMRACHVAWLKSVYIVDEWHEAEADEVRPRLEARYRDETGASHVPAGARVVVTLGVECVGLEWPRAHSVPPKLELREYVLRERWALVHR